VKHDQGGLWRGTGCGFCELVDQVPADKAGRVTAGKIDSRGQSLRPVTFPGPQQARKPADIIRVGDIQRIEINSGSPRHLDGPAWQWYLPQAPAGHHGCARFTVDANDAVVVAVAIGQQAQARARPDLQQGKRLGAAMPAPGAT
jgi:hypothetical protein